MRGANTGEMVRQLLDSGELARTEERLRRKLQQVPDDPTLLRRLADTCRQLGKLAEAAPLYARLAELRPGDVPVARTAALLAGEVPPRLPPIPVTFTALPDFLPVDRLEEVRAWTRTHREGFAATAVKSDYGDVMDDTTRRSASLTDLGPVGEWMRALMAERFPGIRQRLNLPPFAVSVQSLKISRFGDGHFFRLHQDRTEGAAASRRFGFVLYFALPERAFSGGELVLYDLDPETLYPAPTFTTVAPADNTLLVMPANAWHEVLPIRCAGDAFEAGRFTLSGWVHDEAA